MLPGGVEGVKEESEAVAMRVQELRLHPTDKPRPALAHLQSRHQIDGLFGILTCAENVNLLRELL
jgi:hypothetical protein